MKLHSPGLALLVATGLIGVENSVGLAIGRKAKPRAHKSRFNERRWDEMTQADIDRITAAHEKRQRKGRR